MNIPYTDIRVTASRWPWMRRSKPALFEFEAKEGDRYGWFTPSTMGRFGGGFQWNLGVEIGRHTVILNLLFGMIKISWYVPKAENSNQS